jgi:hypothetical protein
VVDGRGLVIILSMESPQIFMIMSNIVITLGIALQAVLLKLSPIYLIPMDEGWLLKAWNGIFLFTGAIRTVTRIAIRTERSIQVDRLVRAKSRLRKL